MPAHRKPLDRLLRRHNSRLKEATAYLDSAKKNMRKWSKTCNRIKNVIYHLVRSRKDKEFYLRIRKAQTARQAAFRKHPAYRDRQRLAHQKWLANMMKDVPKYEAWRERRRQAQKARYYRNPEACRARVRDYNRAHPRKMTEEAKEALRLLRLHNKDVRASVKMMESERKENEREAREIRAKDRARQESFASEDLQQPKKVSRPLRQRRGLPPALREEGQEDASLPVLLDVSEGVLD